MCVCVSSECLLCKLDVGSSCVLDAHRVHATFDSLAELKRRPGVFLSRLLAQADVTWKGRALAPEDILQLLLVLVLVLVLATPPPPPYQPPGASTHRHRHHQRKLYLQKMQGLRPPICDSCRSFRCSLALTVTDAGAEAPYL